MDELILETDGKEIKFSFKDRFWCHLSLKIDDEWIDFGGDSISIIFTRLLIGLIADKGHSDDMPLYTITGVMEPHGWIYGKNYNNHKELLFMDKDCKTIYCINLTSEDIENWIGKIIKHLLN